MIGLWYFTGSGRGAQVANDLAAAMAPGTYEAVDVTPPGVRQEVAGRPLPEDGLVLIFPVYGGVMPEPLDEWLRSLHGGGAPAVAVATWGNVHTGRALRQAQEALTAGGWTVTGGCEYVTEHSNNPALGRGRPTDDERTRLAGYVRERLATSVPLPPFPVQGPDPDHPSLGEFLGLPRGTYVPRVTSIMVHDDERCQHCEICQTECPTGAIDAEWRLNDDLCIRCLRCVTYCPDGAWSKVGTEPRAAAWFAPHTEPKPSVFH